MEDVAPPVCLFFFFFLVFCFLFICRGREFCEGKSRAQKKKKSIDTERTKKKKSFFENTDKQMASVKTLLRLEAVRHGRVGEWHTAHLRSLETSSSLKEQTAIEEKYPHGRSKEEEYWQIVEDGKDKYVELKWEWSDPRVRVEMLQAILESGASSFCPTHVLEAAAVGRLDLVAWAYANRCMYPVYQRAVPSPTTTDFYPWIGTTRILNRIGHYKERCPPERWCRMFSFFAFTEKEMEEVLTEVPLHILQWLVDHGVTPCTSRTRPMWKNACVKAACTLESCKDSYSLYAAHLLRKASLGCVPLTSSYTVSNFPFTASSSTPFLSSRL